jgi:serine/threonine protein kinase/tetratricopeptide (TPR) repeat protein
MSAPDRPIELGPFQLLAPFGKGGMAEVWRGVHVGQHVPVAIKVITATHARTAHFLTAFRNEVQAVARLHHPGIVMVLDHGEVTEEAASALPKRLTAGSPYLAMELASWGSLDRVKLPLPWDDLLRLLLSLLDALAHAHARGVVHRDLKPGNILISAPTDLRPGIKLTDFGIATALEQEQHPGTHEASSGTPHFMAPEQFMSRWRDYGPWTDLYAVGCVAHLLATGKLPFAGDNAMQLAWAHINQAPPRLAAPQAIPAGFEGWIKRLLEKEPRDRFQRAADAGWSLMMLAEAHRKISPEARPAESYVSGSWQPGEAFEPRQPADERPTELSPHTVVQAVYEQGSNPQPAAVEAAELVTLVRAARAQPTLPWVDSQEGLARITTSNSTGATASFPDTYADPKPARRRVPPLPKSWRRSAQVGPSMPLVGAGLGLYGLRAIPMVDRESERDHVWSALHVVRETRTARAVLLHGAAGNGKSRVVEWMSQRADEVGSAISLKATHSSVPGPLDGLARMLQRHLRCGELSRAEASERIARILTAQGVTEPNEHVALTELLYPSRVGDSIIRFSSATERHTLIRRYLMLLAEERPVILWLDDVQWGNDSLSFAIHLLRAQSQSPARILLLLTARDEALLDRPIETQLIEELATLPATSRVHVPPLSPDDQRKLVEELLMLERDLAKQVADRTGGNPLFAVQLVGDWVSRGVLDVGATGFVLQSGEKAVLPDDIREVWRMRVRRLLVHHPATAQSALELAAILGRDVDSSEWERACAEEGIALPPRLLEALLGARLAIMVDDGWTFAHGMLRESLERDAKEADRLGTHHRACAKMLVLRYGAETPGIQERVGRHYLGAGELELALGPLLKGAQERFEASDFASAIRILEDRERGLTSLDLGEDDVRWGEGWVLRARIAILQGQLAEARVWAERAEIKARAWGWSRVLPDAIGELGTIEYERGDQDRAMELFRQASTLYERNNDDIGIARCKLGIADAIYRRGELARSQDEYEGALELFERHKDASGMASCLIGIGYVAIWKNEPARATSVFERQLKLLQGLGNRFRIARCLSALGEAARLAGRTEEAEGHYRRALVIDEAIGSNSAWVVRLNLGLTLMTRERFEEAFPIISAVLSDLVEAGEPSQLAVGHSTFLPCVAAKQDWAAFDHHLAEATRLLDETHLKDGDIAGELFLAGELARRADDHTRARRAYTLSLAQWIALERADKVAETERALAALGPSSDR